MREAIERVIAEIESSQYSAVRNKYEGGFNIGLRTAARLIKEVLVAENTKQET